VTKVGARENAHRKKKEGKKAKKTLNRLAGENKRNVEQERTQKGKGQRGKKKDRGKKKKEKAGVNA